MRRVGKDRRDAIVEVAGERSGHVSDSKGLKRIERRLCCAGSHKKNFSGNAGTVFAFTPYSAKVLNLSEISVLENGPRPL